MAFGGSESRLKSGVSEEEEGGGTTKGPREEKRRKERNINGGDLWAQKI